jgi:cytoskeletal protein CcmA (bactofilin family)
MTRNLRRGVALVAALLLMVLASTVVLGVDALDGKLRTGDDITVPAGETVEGDLYVFAGTVTVEGTVNGDLTAFGGTVTVSGAVTGDVLVAGGTVSIAGQVDGDVRTAGGQVTVSGPVGEDMLAAGGQASLASGGSVGGDLIISGGQVTVAGDVAGSIEGSAGTYSRTGSVGGSDNVVVSPPEVAEDVAGNAVLDALRHFVVLVLFGALMLWLLPRTLSAAERTLRNRPWMSLGGGLLACLGYIVFVIVAILLMVLLAILFGLLRLGSLVGIEFIAGLLAVTGVSFLFLLAVAYFADIVVGLTLARMVASGPSANRWRELALLAAGAAVVVVVTSVPIVGGWVKLLVVLFGLGALALAAWGAWRGRRTPPAGPPMPGEAPPTVTGEAPPTATI